MLRTAAFLATVMVVVVSVATASAECAWVLWERTTPTVAGQQEVWRVLVALSPASGGERSCNTLAAASGRGALEDKQKPVAYTCLPDTVDPRGKAKP